MKKKELITDLLGRGMLLSADFSDNDEVLSRAASVINQKDVKGMLLLSRDTLNLIEKDQLDVNWKELESFKAIAEKQDDSKKYEKFLDCLNSGSTEACMDNIKLENDVKVIFDYNVPESKKEVKDFVAYFNARYNSIEQILRNRQELSGLTSIARLKNKKDREGVCLVGIVSDKKTTVNGHIMLTLEDRTGTIKVLISSNNAEVFESAKNIVLDEVIGITGVCGDKIVFCTGIILPDIPLNKELKKCPDEEYAVFLSDLHVGSEQFLDKNFEKFLSWLNMELGTEEHKKIIPKIKYLFIAGDLVDGVGIYPRQEAELRIKDIYEQYRECARLLSKIPKHINVIICPGNHDSIRLSEPQPAFDKEFAGPLYDLANVKIISNPGIVNIASKGDFPGFDVLMYHGYSFDYYISNVDSIRNNGGYDRADLVMKFLLQRRHLAPSHSSTLYVPDKDQDPLFLNKVVDFFVSGHIHKSYVSSYRNVSLICGSCWQDITSFQIKVGHKPEPAHVPLVNLQTRTTRILRF